MTEANTEGDVIAYFSMEIGLQSDLPTYAGGLGVLAGDTISSAADMKIPMVAVTLLHRHGYFQQSLDSIGQQTEEDVKWFPQDLLEELPYRVSVLLENRKVLLRAWKYEVTGISGGTVPVYFLDANLPENSIQDRALSDHLYGGDAYYRLCQEAILGIGGVRMLRAFGYKNIRWFHMNEGHASLLTLELLDESAARQGRKKFEHEDVQKVRQSCVFTTHTPVPAGHDQFPIDLVKRVLGRTDIFDFEEVFCCEGVLNMTYLALNLSHYVNGVAKRHREISRGLLSPRKPFLHYEIDSITNGVHAGRWTSPPFQHLFDRYIPGWREDNASLRYALNIPKQAVWQAHVFAKQELIDYVRDQAKVEMNIDALTFGFARRATAYKRGELLFRDIERLRRLTSASLPIQVVFAGKAHPQDMGGKEVIRRIFAAKELLKNELKIAYLPNYDMKLAGLITAGVDIWLNTPQPPLEASGTSGMKAALNGVPSLSVLDGWWYEGCLEGITGWALGKPTLGAAVSVEEQSRNDAASLYDKLEFTVRPTFYNDPDRFQQIMRETIAINGSFFNTQRMLQQYIVKAYFV